MPEHDANKVFSKILKLKEPWFVEDVEVTPERVNIYVSTKSRALVKCPLCGESCSIHDHIERTWRHTDVCDSKCFVTAKIPRCNCPKCGVKQMQVPWARENVSFTDSFEGRAMLLM